MTSGADRREYFRIAGTLYLQVSETAFLSLLPIEPEDLGESTDALSLELHQFRQIIRYKQDEALEALDRLAGLVEKVHQAARKNLHSLTFGKKPVIISGSGFDYIGSAPYPLGKKLFARMGFPDYPYTTIEVECEVRHSSPLPGPVGKFKTGLSFENISEENRDQIIKFVNQLQRRLMAHRQESIIS